MKPSRTEDMNIKNLRDKSEFKTREEYYDYLVAMSG